MPTNEAVSTVFASLGAVCWSVQIVPQIYLNHKRRSTDGFSGLMMILWVSAGVPLGIYNIVQNLNIGLQIQPQLFMVFALVCTIQTFHYRLEWPYKKSVSLVFGFSALLAGLEVAGIELLKLGIRNGVHWPVTLIGVISAVLINIGLLPQFWEIYKRNAVIGVSYTFLSIDCAGAIFSFLSLPFDAWDILAAISYGLLIVEEVCIFSLGLAFWLRDRRRPMLRDHEKAEQISTVTNSYSQATETEDNASQTN